MAATAAADIFSLESDDFFNFSPDLTAFDLLAFQGEETARQNQAMLSVLLSPEGSSAFLSRPVELATAFGIQLEGRSWVLVQYPPGASKAEDMMSGVVAAVGGEARREIVGTRHGLDRLQIQRAAHEGGALLGKGKQEMLCGDSLSERPLHTKGTEESCP